MQKKTKTFLKSSAALFLKQVLKVAHFSLGIRPFIVTKESSWNFFIQS